jgi:hypothetical protein
MLSLFSLDANKIEPIAILALAGIAGYFLFAYLRGHAPQSTADPLAQEQAAYLQQAADVSLLQSLTGQGSGVSSTVAANSQPVYSAPATATQSVGATATGSGA